jgi:hypothetical protein
MNALKHAVQKDPKKHGTNGKDVAGPFCALIKRCTTQNPSEKHSQKRRALPCMLPAFSGWFLDVSQLGEPKQFLNLSCSACYRQYDI